MKDTEPEDVLQRRGGGREERGSPNQHKKRGWGGRRGSRWRCRRSSSTAQAAVHRSICSKVYCTRARKSGSLPRASVAVTTVAANEEVAMARLAARCREALGGCLAASRPRRTALAMGQ